MTSTTLPGRESGPDKKALLLPLGASTTACPEPAHAFSADWMREVSGGVDSSALLNCSLLVASCAVSVWQVAGTLGWLTERLSPVATVTPEGVGVGVVVVGVGVGVGVVGVGVGVGVDEGEVDGDGVGEDPVAHAAPFSVNAVGLALVPVTLALKPIGVLPPGASEPFQLSLVTVTCSPLCVQVPSQPLVTCWFPENVKPSVQLVIAVAPLVIVILPVNPPGQLVVTE